MDFTTNYCGMYWSAGKVQSSVVSQLQPVNELDGLCKLHDAAYASNQDLDLADAEFYNQARSLSDPRGYIYGLLVYHGNKLLRMGNFLAPLLYPKDFEKPRQVVYPVLRGGVKVKLDDDFSKFSSPPSEAPVTGECEVPLDIDFGHNPFVDLSMVAKGDPLYEHMSVSRVRRKRRRPRRKYMFL